MLALLLNSLVLTVALWRATASCSMSCNDAIGEQMLQAGVLDVTSIVGDWSLFFAYDNSEAGDSVTFEQTITEGFSETESTEITDTWTEEMGAAVKGLTVKAGYESVTKKYESTTWDASSSTALSITVPAHTKVADMQRVLTYNMQFSAACWSVGSDYCAYATDDYTVAFWLDYESCGTCAYDYSVNRPSFSFNTVCYSASSDLATRDAFCPVTQDSTSVYEAGASSFARPSYNTSLRGSSGRSLSRRRRRRKVDMPAECVAACEAAASRRLQGDGVGSRGNTAVAISKNSTLATYATPLGTVHVDEVV